LGVTCRERGVQVVVLQEKRDGFQVVVDVVEGWVLVEVGDSVDEAFVGCKVPENPFMLDHPYKIM
jgi:hypothetical protein